MEKWTQEQYAARLQEMKQEAHDKMWLYIEVNAKEFMNECEPGAKNLASCCKAMLDAMLEGDGFIVEPKIHDLTLEEIEKKLGYKVRIVTDTKGE